MRFKKTKLTLMLFCFLMSTVLFATSVSAAFNYRHNAVTAQIQQRSLWCWAATSSMAGQYLGATAATQTNIVTYVKGSPTINDSGNISDMQKGLAKYGVSSATYFESFVFSKIKENINSNSNMIAAIAWTNGNAIGHALLIRGYNEDTVSGAKNITYIDPADGSYNMMADSSFRSNNSWTWVNTLSAIYK
ncbi:papain-like cysteine protease family protein [Saccharibacillus sacchari]|uniref:Papain-like cysteine protease family protein n=1 Tax=Saccharibacillus sacchari TaxID=456493 RepID=A0ACC6P5W4_9BACL